jgi:hypothetical protein
MESEVTEPLTSNLRARWGQWWTSCPGRFTVEERAPTPPGSIEWKAEWPPESVWTLWRRDNPLVPAGNRTTIHRTSSLVTTPTNPSQLTLKLNTLMCIFCTMCIAVLTLDVGLLSRSQYPEGPATGHLDTGFSLFPCVYKRMLRWFPSVQVATTCLSCSPPDLKLLVNVLFIFVYM